MTIGLRRHLTAAVVLASLFAVSAPTLAQAAPRTSGATARHAVKRHAHHRRHAIPQHNGGDRDGDNNGGRTDGDGNV